MTQNAVLQLREQRLALATRPFNARGSRVVRCQRCLLPTIRCLCHTIVPQQARSRFCLIMFDTEPMKPSNTGRLIADILPNTLAFQWSRTMPNPALLAAIQSSHYQPYVVFLAEEEKKERKVFHQLPDTGKTPLFIMLDGTWPEARKMFRKSPYLDSLPILSLSIEALSRYQLREASVAGQQCTAEIAVALLEQAGDNVAAQTLNHHFEHFRKSYLAGKPHHPADRSENTR